LKEEEEGPKKSPVRKCKNVLSNDRFQKKITIIRN